MIYGDEPLRLHAYTYSPQITAIAQSGNLYFYALNNPVAYWDSSGENSIALTQALEMSGLVVADGPLPIGDIIYGVIVLKALLDDRIQSIDVSTYYPESKTTSTSRGGSGFS